MMELGRERAGIKCGVKERGRKEKDGKEGAGRAKAGGKLLMEGQEKKLGRTG